MPHAKFWKSWQRAKAGRQSPEKRPRNSRKTKSRKSWEKSQGTTTNASGVRAGMTYVRLKFEGGVDKGVRER